MIKISYIQEFVMLVDTLNFSRAAELTHITQPALSRHIAVLEEEVGAKLLVRDTRNVRLTSAGEAVYKHFCDILFSFKEAKDQAVSLSTGKVGILKVSSPYYWTEDFTEPIVLQMLQEYPKCDIRVISCQPHEGMQDILEGRSDVLISYYVDNLYSSIRRVAFAKEKLSVVLHITHPLAQHACIKMEDLKNNSFIFTKSDDDETKHATMYILKLLEARGIKPKHMHYTQQVDTVGMTIKSTGGISILPYCVRHMNRSYIKVIPLEDTDCEIAMCMYYRTDNDNAIIPQFVQAGKSINLLSG